MRSPSNNGPFPTDFTWGAATSAYQIEGAADADGKGPSIWDEFGRRDGAIRHGDVGDTACEHYRRFRDDVRLMSQIGLAAYRFSISWPRVLPAGAGAVNSAGLDFYDALVDALLAEGVQPWATLFHWDYPAALAQRGGWLHAESPHWFADYVRVVVERLSDRVTHWITINEPQVFLDYGHRAGHHAPGLKLSRTELLLATHHCLLAHGRAVQTIRASARQTPRVGWAPVGIAKAPRNASSAADVEAALAAAADVDGETIWNNVWYNDPVFFGRYPKKGLSAYGDAVPTYTADDMQLIAEPLDFLGLNIYTADMISADANAPVPCAVGAPRNTLDWPLVESSLYWGPKFFHGRYQRPIVITENGLANNDWVSLDGAVHDPQRIDYTARYLGQLQRAIAEGVDVRGYFHWSLLDNFEWSEGYGPRFGLVHVDFQTQVRTLKDSAHWYASVIGSNGP